MKPVKSAIIVMLAAASSSFAAPPRPYFLVPAAPRAASALAAGFPTWTYHWRYRGKAYAATFIGADPAANSTTRIRVDIIPIKLTIGSAVEDPTAPDYSGRSPLATTLASPVFNAGIDYRQGGIDIGNTQYIDAVQRAGFWHVVKSHRGYHVLFATPSVQALQSWLVPKDEGTIGQPFGITVAEVDLTWFGNKVTSLLKSLRIPPNTLPIFMTSQTYLESDGYCCGAGYHDYFSNNTYAYVTYISNPGGGVTLSQDVSGLTHEAAEWLNDPYLLNGAPPSCAMNGIGPSYEVADPLVSTANNGDYAYTLGGTAYHLQDIVTPVYFGAAASTAANHWFTFQGYKFAVCQNGS